jgi:hypothetical protein
LAEIWEMAEERAAIKQFEGGLDKLVAEKEAGVSTHLNRDLLK